MKTSWLFQYTGIEAIAWVSIAVICAAGVGIAIVTANLEKDRSKITSEKRKSRRIELLKTNSGGF